MNTDIRLAVSFATHRKRRKLQREMGAAGVLALVDLLLATAMNRPDGHLGGDPVDIEMDAGWEGEPGALVAALERVGFVDRVADGWRVHDWSEHNPYAASARDRSERARVAARARWSGAGGRDGERSQEAEGPDQGPAASRPVARPAGKNHAPRPRPAGGSRAVSPRTHSPAHAASPPAHCPDHAAAAAGNAPSPSPSPAPEEQRQGQGQGQGRACLSGSAGTGPCAPDRPAAPGSCREGPPGIPLAAPHPPYRPGPDLLADLAARYPGLDVPAQLAALAAWNRDNPARRKQPGDILRHIHGWLRTARTAPAPSPGPPMRAAAPDGPGPMSLARQMARELLEAEHGERANDPEPTGPAGRGLPHVPAVRGGTAGPGPGVGRGHGPAHGPGA